MSHEQIASTSEPWFMLPLCYARRKEGIVAEYGHTTSATAICRIEADIGQGHLDRLINEFAMGIYAKYGTGRERYFLDKTPRYYYILPELIRIFPEARFVVLLRNPISIVASAIEAFCGNSMRRFDALDRDFYEGPERIAEFILQHRDRIHLLTYEGLVGRPESTIRNICEYLELTHCPDMIKRSFDITLDGFGDQLGSRKYRQVVSDHEKWKQVVNTRYRSWRLKRLIEKFSEHYLNAGGYDRGQLLESIATHRTQKVEIKEYGFLLEELLVRAYKSSINRH